MEHDGGIDYSRYTLAELHEALAGIRREAFPLNHAKLIAELESRREVTSVAPLGLAPTPADSDPLASRGSRLGAYLVDGLIAVAVICPIMYFLGFWQLAVDAARSHSEVPLGLLLQMQALGFLLFVVLQGYPLARDGQTWGKKGLGIKIVDMAGNKPSLARLLLRYGSRLLVSWIPVVGQWLVLIDDCAIFGAQKRCGHDYVAGTRVVRAGLALG
jgi:uncharacterized RDD family membrane protein YckC